MYIKDLFQEFDKNDSAYLYCYELNITIEHTDYRLPTTKVLWNEKWRKLYTVSINRNSHKNIVMFMMKNHIIKAYKNYKWELKVWDRYGT